MSSRTSNNKLSFLTWSLLGLISFVFLILTGCSESSPQSVINKTVSIEQGDYFSHNFRLNRGATVELIAESQNMPIKIFISTYKDTPAAIAGLPVSVWFLSSDIYGETKRGYFEKGDYTLVVRHGKDKGFFDSASPAARVKISLTVQ